MPRFMMHLLAAALVLAVGPSSAALARGFGAVRGGGFAAGPGGGFAAGAFRGGAAVGPLGGVRAGGAQGGTFVGPRGTTVQAGRAGGVAVGPFGGVQAAGARGVQVTTPGGRTLTAGSAGRVGTGPLGGVRAGGVQGALATGPFGGVAGGRFGGVAVGPGGVGVARGGAVAAGRATRFVSPADVRRQAAFVRGGFYHGAFTPGWYQVHRAAWRPLRWRVPNYWVAPVWRNVALYVGLSAPPVVYNFGTNVVIVNNLVFVDGSQVASADQFARQAAQFAAAGRAPQPPAEEEWQPLGVFGLVQEDEQTAQHIFQLAINKNGIVRGNFYDVISDTTLPVFGALDRATQRVAWSIGEHRDIVFEAGFKNLTENAVPILEHFGTERTQQLLMIRLDRPGDSK